MQDPDGCLLRFSEDLGEKEVYNMVIYKNIIPSADEFNYLTNSVGWGTRENKIVEEALRNTVYSLCAYDGDKLIGYERIIGDKTIFL